MTNKAQAELELSIALLQRENAEASARIKELEENLTILTSRLETSKRLINNIDYGAT
jgi:vacuolar-type H+-ATPase subunit D/Vma8